MKKLLCILVFLLGVSGYAGLAEEPDRELTLMVYMCGSNLESVYGSATEDLAEMRESGFQDDRISVLVMTGGAQSRNGWFDSGKTAIHEVMNGKNRRVWTSERMNMGSRDTLTQLLRFGAERYPAKKYALILWDHGGGPLEGICWDELFSMDHLSLRELTEGLRMAGYPEKLSWIGFDACLMCTAEVAKAVSPYAEYMIGSQETEPPSGWNYAFLKGLEKDPDGEETGRRIVESYFDSLQDSEDLLTMACVDLSRIDALTDSMDSFFRPLGNTVSEKTFQEVSGVRRASSGFGQTVRSVGMEGYDLVDLSDLVSRFGRDDAELQEAIRGAVVCSRANREGAGGLSVYHPYMNKAKYLESWGEDYKNLDFSSGYARYVDRFGAMLTGEELVDWSGLVTRDLGIDEEGNHHFSLDLTEAQRKETASVQLLILEKLSIVSESPERVFLVDVENTELDETGKVTGNYRGGAVYAADESGNILGGPFSFMRTEDGEYYIFHTFYYDYSIGTETREDAAVLYYCRLNPETGSFDVARRYVYDSHTQTWTSRIAFSEEGYTEMNFVRNYRYLPDPDQVIAGYDEWTSCLGPFQRGIQLPAKWHFQLLENRQDASLYATFQVTDIRQNTWSSRPVPIVNPYRSAVPLTPSAVEQEKYAVRISAERRDGGQNPGLSLKIETENRSEEELYFSGTRFILNGTRMTQDALWSTVKPGEQTENSYYFSGKDLMGLDEIRTVDFSLNVSGGLQDAEKITSQVHLETASCDVAGFAAAVESMDEVQTEKGLWQLVSLTQERDGSFSGLLHVRNDTTEELNTKAALLLNGVRLKGEVSVRLCPHTDMYISFDAENAATVSRYELHAADTDQRYLLVVPQAAEQAGVRRAERLDLYPGLDDSRDSSVKISFTLPEALALQEAEQVPARLPLLEGDVSVELERVLIADDGLALGLRLRNDADEGRFLQMCRPEVNGKAYARFRIISAEEIMLPAHSSAVYCLILEIPEKIRRGTPAEEMRFVFQTGDAVSEPAGLVFPQGTVFGASGGTLLEAADLAEVIPAVFAE